MPIQAPQWTDYLNCPVCCREFGPPPRSPISLGCGHTLCSQCLKHLHRKQCPFDQTVIQLDLDELVVNTAILQLAGYPPPEQPYHPPCIQALPEEDAEAYNVIVKCMESLAAYLKLCGASTNLASNRLSRPMQRKLLTVLQCAITDEEGRGRAARAARSLGERTVTELILQHQNSQQLSANLWAAVRARGCQFLGPAMQEEVLKLILLVLEDGSPLSRKVLVMFVVQRLEPHFPQASKTSIGHVVQLLYRASCFKVSKRESDSSLMQLKEEFRSYELLRREHDAQIVQIATESGLRIAPDQWSSLLYGDTAHKSHMQSIIDKLQTPASFSQSVQELLIAMERSGEAVKLATLRSHLELLSSIEPGPDLKNSTWQELSEILSSLKEVISQFLEHVQHQLCSKDATMNKSLLQQDNNTVPLGGRSTPMPMPPYIMIQREGHCPYCPLGTICNHEEDMDRYNDSVANGNAVHINGNGNVLHGVPAMPPQMGPQVLPMPPPTMVIYPPIYPPGQRPPMRNHNYMTMPPMHMPPMQLATMQRQQMPQHHLHPQHIVTQEMPPPPMQAMQLPHQNMPPQHFNGPPFNIMHPYPNNAMHPQNDYYRFPMETSNIYGGAAEYAPHMPPPGFVPNYKNCGSDIPELGPYMANEYQPAPDAKWPTGADAAWPKINNNIYDFDETALPQSPAATDHMLMSIGAQMELGLGNKDDKELEEELHALEQRIVQEL